MTNPVLTFRRQGQGHKSKGAGSALQYDGAYTPELFAFSNPTTGADRQIVAATTGKKIRVLSYLLSAPAGGGTITFKTAAAAIGPLITLGANGLATEADNNGLFETNAGEALNTNSSATFGVRVTYILVD